mmetsp:Transcript_8425/g.18172  ORF Transcript_8425/g.18172 Transcript_8425/m.18172 type:complete len:132 (-) Transcript_8425:1934-2329(-)
MNQSIIINRMNQSLRSESRCTIRARTVRERYYRICIVVTTRRSQMLLPSNFFRKRTGILNQKGVSKLFKIRKSLLVRTYRIFGASPKSETTCTARVMDRSVRLLLIVVLPNNTTEHNAAGVVVAVNSHRWL